MSADPKPYFGSLATGLASAVSKIDGNRFMELVISDVGGMGIPRTAIEGIKRGPDAARENAIRDGSGTTTNMFLVGAYSALMLALLGDRMNKVANSLGMAHKRWINADSLEMMGHLYQDALHDVKSSGGNLKQVEALFLTNYLKAIRANDPQNSELIANLMRDSGQSVSKSMAEGGLSTKGVKKLQTEMLEAATDLTAMAKEGTFANSLTQSELDKALKSKRLDLSLSRYRHDEKQLAQKLMDIAIPEGLSETVDVAYKDLSVSGRSLKDTLVQGFRFVEEHIRPATHGLDHDKPIQSVTQKVEHRLLDAVDGTIPKAMKSKTWFTKLPMVFTIATGVSVAFLNNWLTKRKNNGVDYFPGEGKAALGSQVTALENAVLPTDLSDVVSSTGTQLNRPALFQTIQAASGLANQSASQLKFAGLVSGADTSGAAKMPGLDLSADKNQLNDPQFGNRFAVAEKALNYTVKKPDKFLKVFDFHNYEIGNTTVNQVKMIYGAVILSRWAAASTRSFNELRESMMRDGLGYTTWLFFMPMLQRLFVKVATPNVDGKMHGILMKENLNQPKWNPLTRYDLTTAGQLKNRMTQVDNAIEHAVQKGLDAVELKDMKGLLEKATRWRAYNTAFGMASTIAMLGVVINLVNMAITQKNVEAGKVGKNR